MPHDPALLAAAPLAAPAATVMPCGVGWKQIFTAFDLSPLDFGSWQLSSGSWPGSSGRLPEQSFHLAERNMDLPERTLKLPEQNLNMTYVQVFSEPETCDRLLSGSRENLNISQVQVLPGKAQTFLRPCQTLLRQAAGGFRTTAKPFAASCRDP